MPPDLAALEEFVTGPGGALALALFIILALVRGWLVPGFIYNQAVDRGDRAVAGLEATGAALDRLTDEVRTTRRDNGRTRNA